MSDMGERKGFDDMGAMVPFGSLLQLHIPAVEGLVEIARHVALNGVCEVKAGRWELVYVFIEWEWRLVSPSGQVWRFAHHSESDLLHAILGTIRRVWSEAHLDAFDKAIEGNTDGNPVAASGAGAVVPQGEPHAMRGPTPWGGNL